MNCQPGKDADETMTIVAGHFDSLVHRGLASLLGEDRSVRLLASGLDGAALESVVAEEMPQVVILDGRTGGPALERVKGAMASETGILVLAHQPSRADLVATRSLGVACLSLSATDSDLLAAVCLVAQGEPVYTSSDGRRVVRPRPLATTHDLTDRETEVLAHLSHASSDAEIALALQISTRTVETHVARIRRKTGVEDRRDFVGLQVQQPPREAAVMSALVPNSHP
jgi:two-component system, NarL family, response regulator NreC